MLWRRNIVDDDTVGAIEFSCAVSGAKLVVLLGHTSCAAVEGAIDDVELGCWTGLLARIKPAIFATAFEGEKSSRNAAYVAAVARTNVKLGVEKIRKHSQILAELESQGTIRIAGAMYNLTTGAVDFVSEKSAAIRRCGVGLVRACARVIRRRERDLAVRRLPRTPRRVDHQRVCVPASD